MQVYPRTTILLKRVIASDSSTWHLATVQQLCLLSAETLRLYLSEKSLETTGNKLIMAQRLNDHIYSIITQAIATNVPVTPNTSSVPLNTFPSLQPAMTTIKVNAQVTTSISD